MLLFFTLSATYEMGPLCVPQPPKGSPVPELAALVQVLDLILEPLLRPCS